MQTESYKTQNTGNSPLQSVATSSENLEEMSNEKDKHADKQKVVDEATKEVNDLQGAYESANEVVDETDVNELTMEFEIQRVQNEISIEVVDNSHRNENYECYIISDTPDIESKKVDDVIIQCQSIERNINIIGSSNSIALESADMEIDDDNDRESDVNTQNELSTVSANSGYEHIQGNEDSKEISKMVDEGSEKKLYDESYVESLPSSSTRDFGYQYLSEQNDSSPVNEVEKIYSNEDEKISEVFPTYTLCKIK